MKNYHIFWSFEYLIFLFENIIQKLLSVKCKRLPKSDLLIGFLKFYYTVTVKVHIQLDCSVHKLTKRYVRLK